MKTGSIAMLISVAMILTLCTCVRDSGTGESGQNHTDSSGHVNNPDDDSPRLGTVYQTFVNRSGFEYSIEIHFEGSVIVSRTLRNMETYVFSHSCMIPGPVFYYVCRCESDDCGTPYCSGTSSCGSRGTTTLF